MRAYIEDWQLSADAWLFPRRFKNGRKSQYPISTDGLKKLIHAGQEQYGLPFRNLREIRATVMERLFSEAEAAGRKFRSVLKHKSLRNLRGRYR